MRILGFLKSTLWHAVGCEDQVDSVQNSLQISYGVSDAWDSHLAKDIYALEMVQNRAVRFISSLSQCEW